MKFISFEETKIVILRLNQSILTIILEDFVDKIYYVEPDEDILKTLVDKRGFDISLTNKVVKYFIPPADKKHN